jgi:hypothetical protein
MVSSLHTIHDTLGHSNIATTSVYLHADEKADVGGGPSAGLFGWAKA